MIQISFVQLFTNKFGKVDEMDNFLDKYNLSKSTQVKTESLNIKYHRRNRRGRKIFPTKMHQFQIVLREILFLKITLWNENNINLNLKIK